ncbi:MAG: cupin domain-containing protein [Longimicrobiales bacterium]
MTTEQDPQSALATPTHLLDLLDYQDRSVVSRTLMKKATGTLTLFAFDAGEGLSEHSTPYDAVVQILDGAAEITVGGIPYTVKAGQGLLLPAEVPHALAAVVPFKMLLIMIREPRR